MPFSDSNGQLYNSMIVPYTTGPMSLSGILWSQGECNADLNTTSYYQCAFPKLITDWRQQFGAPSAFFSFELLPAYINDSVFSPASLPYERDAQLKGAASLHEYTNTVVVVNAMDLGDPTAPHGSVHPRNKATVALRMSWAARATLYHDLQVVYLNPSYEAAKAVTQSTHIKVTITFVKESLSGGTLVIQPTTCPTQVPPTECMWNEVQTVDGRWWNASASIVGGDDNSALLLSVELPSTASSLRVNATRGNFSPWPVVHVYSAPRSTSLASAAEQGGLWLPALPWYEPVDSADVVE